MKWFGQRGIPGRQSDGPLPSLVVLRRALPTGNWIVKRFLLLAALIPCGPAAADWQQVFVDKASIERAKGITRACMQQYFVKERHSGHYACNSLDGLNAGDREDNKVTLLRVAVHLDVKVMESYMPDESGGDRSIIPGTVGYFAYRCLCPPGKK